MKIISITVLVLVLIAGVFIFITGGTIGEDQTNISSNDSLVKLDQNQSGSDGVENVSQTEPIKVIAGDLEIPWDIAFLPDGDLLVTERTGHLLKINPKTGEKISIPVPGVKPSSEGGLLGVTLHPQFSQNKFIYLYYGVSGQGGETNNQVVRYVFENNSLGSAKTIVANIPGAIYHDGGRIQFGPDGLLYITTGDATRSNIAQDLTSLGGKILRLKDDGTIPPGNPFGTAVYSYGHRNPQGLAWDAMGKLWATEHGRSGVLSGLDEINLIEPGKNYGWPEIQGDETRADMVTPTMHSGTRSTWAPASLAHRDGKLYFGGLLGEGLYEVTISENGSAVSNLKKYFDGEYGRIRTVRFGPDGFLYMTTSNRDGRGKVQTGDDKIIRVDIKALTKASP